MKKFLAILVAILNMLSICTCVYADAAWSCVYWVGIDADTNDHMIMQTDTDGNHFPIANVNSGYLLEGGSDIYYATTMDKNHWEIYKLDSSELIVSFEDPDVIRILSYQNNTVFMIKSVDGMPILAALAKDRSIKTYPQGKYSAEFADFTDESNRTVLFYTATISADGKIAYCIDEGVSWQSYSDSIYITTLEQADFYVAEGSHPVWLDVNNLLYVGVDSKLYRYDVSEQASHPCFSDENNEISLPTLDPTERMTRINEDYIGFVQLQGERRKLSLLSLQTGKTQMIDCITPLNFMDVIVIVSIDA